MFVGLGVFAFYNLSIGYVRRYTSTHSQTDILSFKHAFPLFLLISFIFHTPVKSKSLSFWQNHRHITYPKMKLTNIGTKSALRQAILNEVTCLKAILLK